MYNVDSHIIKNMFRAYDIRGNTNHGLDHALAYKIGYSFADSVCVDKKDIICIGRDNRFSSGNLYQGLTQGIIDRGFNVISIGTVPTPVLYFADKVLNPQASIMITGSHNPKDDNGFKMLAHGKSFFGEDIQKLYECFINTRYDHAVVKSKNDITLDNTISHQYLTKITQDIKVNPALKICWDPANGAACEILQKLIAKLPNKNIVINGVMDGSFPAHHPDPTVPQNLMQLIDNVIKHQCDIGISFDGDADRIGVVTKTGKIIYGDQLLAIFAQDILTTLPQSTIIADVKASQGLFDIIKACNGNPIMWKTGHSLIKAKMQETKAMLAGEMSGHIFFADKYYGYDDAIYAALRLIDLLSRSVNSFEEMVATYPILHTSPEQRIKISTAVKNCVISKIKEKLDPTTCDINEIDGLRVSSKQGWWLIRTSNTEESLIIRYEATSSEGYDCLRNELKQLFAQCFPEISVQL